MSAVKKFIAYQVVLDVDCEDDSYCLFEALRHYRRYVSAQDLQNEPEIHSIHRLINMVDTAWMNSANMVTKGDERYGLHSLSYP